MRKLTLLFLIISMTLGCTKVYNETTAAPTSTDTTTPVVPLPADKIEFRVFGQDLIGNVVIHHTDPINGVTLYNGGVPYFASIESKDDSIFLFIEATGNGKLPSSAIQVQIFVNGKLFREAFSQGFEMSVQASGTYRRVS